LILRCGNVSVSISNCHNRQSSYIYVYLIWLYQSNCKILWYHPSIYYFTPPWGVSTNQGKDIRAYVNGWDFYFSSANWNSPPKPWKTVKSPLRHCDSPIKMCVFGKMCRIVIMCWSWNYDKINPNREFLNSLTMYQDGIFSTVFL
jgi:hypothetical protein